MALGFSNRTEVRRELLAEIITGIDQMIDLFITGGSATLTGHAYDSKEKEREITLLKQLRMGLTEMLEAET